MISTNYFHATDGRIRIHIAEVKGSGVIARQAAAKLMEYDGIVNVNANPVTGNVLINYDPSRISQGGVFQVLHNSRYLRQNELTAPSVQIKGPDHSEWGGTVARFALEALFLALTG